MMRIFFISFTCPSDKSWYINEYDTRLLFIVVIWYDIMYNDDDDDDYNSNKTVIAEKGWQKDDQ